MNTTTPPPPSGCLVVVTQILVWFLLLTPGVMIAWNVGLHPSGLIDRDISWVTAFGLAMAITIFRSVVSALRRQVVVMPVVTNNATPPPHV